MTLAMNLMSRWVAHQSSAISLLYVGNLSFVAGFVEGL